MTGKPVSLPEGAEVQMSVAALKQELKSGATHIKLMVRCPGAKNAAPYMVDASDLWLMVN